VRNNKDSAILKGGLELLLNEIICLEINISSSLIKHQNLSLPDDRSSQAQKLLLPQRENVVALSDLCLDTAFTILIDMV
jgi:hypothetical protein